MSDFKFDNGDEVEDRITGFTGVIVGKHSWLNNCNTYSVQSRILKEGAVQKFENFDEPQLKLIAAKVIETHQDTGGPNREVVRPGI
jgi:hypothetical protein